MVTGRSSRTWTDRKFKGCGSFRAIRKLSFSAFRTFCRLKRATVGPLRSVVICSQREHCLESARTKRCPARRKLADLCRSPRRFCRQQHASLDLRQRDARDHESYCTARRAQSHACPSRGDPSARAGTSHPKPRVNDFQAGRSRTRLRARLMLLYSKRPAVQGEDPTRPRFRPPPDLVIEIDITSPSIRKDSDLRTARCSRGVALHQRRALHEQARRTRLRYLRE